MIKRKPHQQGLDPQNPGIPVSAKSLQEASKTFHTSQAQALGTEGLQPGSLTGAPVGDIPTNLTGVDPVAAIQPHQDPSPPPSEVKDPGGNGKEAKGNNGQTPEPPIPSMFNALGGDSDSKHPLLEDLEYNFGIERLQCKDIMLGGYKWTFRPMRFEDYEWMSNHVRRNNLTQEASEPSMSVTSVAAILAAVNGTPVYELFNVNTVGRHIPDKMNPPPDIKFEAAIYLLEWFREKVGMWELIGKLDEQVDIIFEEQRSSEYPLWETLASPYRQRIIELKKMLDSSKGQDGKPGDDASQQQGSSPPTPEPSSSGITPEQPNSSSTGQIRQTSGD